jgi:hypothetical protein
MTNRKTRWTRQAPPGQSVRLRPSGNEPFAEREAGAGTLAEFDVSGNQKTVVGISLLRGAAHEGDRRVVGG